MFADEKVVHTVAALAPPYTWVAPLFLMPLGVFVAIIQTFVFILLSQLYLSEVSHAPHEEHAEHGDDMHSEHDHGATGACGSGSFMNVISACQAMQADAPAHVDTQGLKEATAKKRANGNYCTLI